MGHVCYYIALIGFRCVMLLVAWLLNDNENYWIPLVLLEYVLTADTAAPRREATRGFVWAVSTVLRNGHWIRERSDRGSATRTRANMGQCLRTLRARRPEPSGAMHARRVFVLHNMHTPLDFNSVDFLGMLEVLGLQLIFMHRGNWGISYEVITVPLCLDNTVTVGHWLYDVLIVCLLLCWLRPMYSSRHTKVNAIPL